MNENTLRKLVRESIVAHFHKKIRKLHEQKDTAKSGVDDAVEELVSLNDEAMQLAKSSMSSALKQAKKPDEKKKQTESVTMLAAGVLLGLPGLLELMSKLAKMIRKNLNKHFKTGVSVKHEGEALEAWAHATHEFYINRLFSPIVKIVFKKYVGNDAKKVKKFAVVLYAAVLAIVAGHAIGTAGMHIAHGLADAGHTFSVAYEAAHGTHGAIDALKISQAVVTAFEAVGEEAVAEAIVAGA